MSYVRKLEGNIKFKKAEAAKNEEDKKCKVTECDESSISSIC